MIYINNFKNYASISIRTNLIIIILNNDSHQDIELNVTI